MKPPAPPTHPSLAAPEAVIERLPWAWRASLISFTVAALTGAAFRFQIAYGLFEGLNPVNVRHAHSHLMYFGWATPLLMALIWQHLPRLTGNFTQRPLKGVLVSVFAAAALAYPLFLAFGYSPVALGNANIPLAVIGASLNVFAWYAFVYYYVRATRGIERRHRTFVLWDMAVIFLVLSTGGAWALPLLKPFGIEDPALTTALTHIFLDLFSEGWFVLGVLGLAYAHVWPVDGRPGHWSLWLLCAGLPLTFVLGMPLSLVPPELKALAALGGLLIGVGLLANVFILTKALSRERVWLWSLPLLFLALKASGQIANSLIPGVWWGSQPGMRILYLHLMLLGFVTLGLVGAATLAWGVASTRSVRTMYAAVPVLILSLIPLTGYLPAAWAGRWMFVSAAWVALLPIAAAFYMLASEGERRSLARSSARPRLSSMVEASDTLDKIYR